MTSTFTIADAIAQARASLRDHSDSPHLDATLLLAHILHCDRATLIAHPERFLDDAAIAAWDLALQRRIKGEPIAYITEGQWFWQDYFKVSPDVLVPRADSECLVETVLAMGGVETSLSICEVGTGSGCLIISLAKARPNWQCLAVDISEAALAIASDNAERIVPGRVTFQRSDAMTHVEGVWDWVISNPPYIASDDPCLQNPGVRAEPRLALVADEDGLALIHRLIHEARSHLKVGGHLLLEHGATQGKAVRDRMLLEGYREVVTVQDHGRRDRATRGQWVA